MEKANQTFSEVWMLLSPDAMNSNLTNTATNKTLSVSNDEQLSDRRRLVSLLEQIGVRSDRFYTLKEGHKRPAPNGWQKPENQISLLAIEGNAGMVAGDGIVVIDDDTYGEGLSLPRWVADLIASEPTYERLTPHGGMQYLFHIEGAQGAITTALGLPTDQTTKRYEWGEIQFGPANSVVVGSEVNHTNCPDSKPCEGNSVDRYVSTFNERIASVPIDALTGGMLNEQRSSSEPVEPIGESREGVELVGSLNSWIETGRTNGEKFDVVCRWAEGEGSGLFNDRSRNELSLCHRLYYRLGGFHNPDEKVIAVMNDFSPPKWRSSSKGYKESILRFGRKRTIDIDNFYQPESIDLSNDSDNEYQFGEVSRETAMDIIAVATVLPEKFRTKDILSTYFTTFSDRQARRVLGKLRDAGYLRTDGNNWHKLAPLPTGRAQELFLEGYRPMEKIVRQRAEFMKK